MGRPDPAADCLDRIESSLEISQLPSRYAMALGARDLDALVALFVAGDPGVPARLSRLP